MRAGVCVAVMAAVLWSLAAPAWAADEDIKPDEMRKLYQDTLNQLTAAQNRKAELAAENEKLTARVAELEKRLKAAEAENAESQRLAGSFAERTFYLRADQSAWQTFLQSQPDIYLRWQLFVNRGLAALPYDLSAFAPASVASSAGR
jgi:Skp family chaperone for outer membrane proteins